ncbi:MAG: aconitase family protein, partial [Thermoplasmata archaeon]
AFSSRRIQRSISFSVSRNIAMKNEKEYRYSAGAGAGAGAIGPNPSCGLCTTGHHGILAQGEVLLSTSNRNFPGKVGKGGKVYLASPATAAASSIKGEITSPGGL